MDPQRETQIRLAEAAQAAAEAVAPPAPMAETPEEIHERLGHLFKTAVSISAVLDRLRFNLSALDDDGLVTDPARTDRQADLKAIESLREAHWAVDSLMEHLGDAWNASRELSRPERA